MDYEVSTKKNVNEESNIKGFATVNLGRCFKIENIAIMSNHDGELFVSMPKRKTNKVDERNRPVYEDICNPITADFRKELYDNIIESYKTGENITVAQNERPQSPIYRVNVTPLQTDNSLVAMGSVIFDEAFAVNGVSIRQKDENTYVFMPSVKTGRLDANGYPEKKEVCHPSSKEFSQDLEKTFKSAYQMKAEQLAQNNQTKNEPKPAKKR